MLNIFDSLTHHANLIIDKKLFDDIVADLYNSSFRFYTFLYNSELDGGKNLHIDEVRDIYRIINIKTSDKIYILISKRLANTIIQNSLLKLLEETGRNICFLIFVENIKYLLPTVLSRLNIINPEQSLKQIENNFFDTEIQNLYSSKLNKILASKNFIAIINIETIKDYFYKGAISEKNFIDYLKLL